MPAGQPACQDEQAAASTSAAPAQSASDRLTEYLLRIRFPGFTRSDDPLPPPTLDTLCKVHTCHTREIAFENLSFVHPRLKASTRPVDAASLHFRLVTSKRGGMCQEMNGALHGALTALGFHVYQGLANVVTPGSLVPAAEPLQGPPCSTQLGATYDMSGIHQVLFVRVDGSWYLADVGFGNQGLVEPLLLQAYDDDSALPPPQQLPGAIAAGARGESLQVVNRYRLRRAVAGSAEPLSSIAACAHRERDSHVGWCLQSEVKGVWSDMYYFNTTLVHPAVLAACAEDSFRRHPLFTTTLIVTRHDDTSRLSLADFELKTRTAGQPTVTRMLESEAERDEVLKNVFGLQLTKIF